MGEDDGLIEDTDQGGAHGLEAAPPEDGLALAERQIRKAEARIARQAAIAQGFETAGDGRAAEQAREAAAVMRMSLALAHLYFLVEFASLDDEPNRQVE